MGVIFGLVPRTHPVATFVFKVLIALKGRNALILSSHRGAQRVSNRAGELITAVPDAHGCPRGLVQWLRERQNHTRQITRASIASAVLCRWRVCWSMSLGHTAALASARASSRHSRWAPEPLAAPRPPTP
jgi:hypothetical protein